MDKDLEQLIKMDEAMRGTSDKMKRAQLIFLWDKYVVKYIPAPTEQPAEEEKK